MMHQLRKTSLQEADLPSHVSFVRHKGVLYRRILARNQGERYQVVIPQALVLQVMGHFHQRPAGGHVGRLKTLMKVLKLAWWPSVRKDIGEYTTSCKACHPQKVQNTCMPGLQDNTTKTLRKKIFCGKPSPQQHVLCSQAERGKGTEGVSKTRPARYWNAPWKEVPFQQGDLVWLRPHPFSYAQQRNSPFS